MLCEDVCELRLLLAWMPVNVRERGNLSTRGNMMGSTTTRRVGASHGHLFDDLFPTLPARSRRRDDDDDDDDDGDRPDMDCSG